MVVRHLRRRPVDPRRHAVRRHARPRGRRAPVRDHAEHRHRAAGLHRLRARLRPGLRVVLPARAVAARQARRHERLLPALARGRSTRTATPGHDEEAIAGGYKLQRNDDAQVTIAVMGALVPEALEAASILGNAEVVCITSADHALPLLPGPRGPRRRRPGHARPPVHQRPPDRQPHRWAPPHALVSRQAPASACSSFGQAGDIVDLYEHHEIDAESVVGAALDLLGLSRACRRTCAGRRGRPATRRPRRRRARRRPRTRPAGCAARPRSAPRRRTRPRRAARRRPAAPRRDRRAGSRPRTRRRRCGRARRWSAGGCAARGAPARAPRRPSRGPTGR